MSHNPPSPQNPFTGEVRFRVPLPLLIPFAAIAVIALITIGLSRVLLSIPAEAATTVALAVSANVLIACAILASRPRLEQTSLVEMAIIVVYPILIGIVIAQLGIGGDAHGAPGEQHGAANGAASTSGENGGAEEGAVVAQDFEFQPDEVTTTGEIAFENEDSAPHNIYIYPDADAADAAQPSEAIFQGEDVQGGAATTYDVSEVEPGDYPFICQIHPSMTGTITIE